MLIKGYLLTWQDGTVANERNDRIRNDVMADELGLCEEQGEV
jgi:hypothetical protein